MTKAVFHYQKDLFLYLEISGHTGYQESGSDIVCSAISTAVFTTINLIDKIYGNKNYQINQNEETGYLKFLISSNINQEKIFNDIIENLYDMLSDIRNDYKPFLNLKKENKL